MRKATLICASRCRLVVLGVLGAWRRFYLVGPPAEERARQTRARREDRSAAAASGRRSVLDAQPPAARLARRAAQGGRHKHLCPRPAIRRAIRYAVKGADAYELCAEFARESEPRGDFWSHGAGKRCFQITAKAIAP